MRGRHIIARMKKPGEPKIPPLVYGPTFYSFGYSRSITVQQY